MKKMRAKFEHQTMFERVSEYVLAHADKNSKEVAKDLGLTPQKVYGVKAVMKTRGMLKAAGEKTDALDEKDIVTVHNIGIEKVKRIVKLLEALK